MKKDIKYLSGGQVAELKAMGANIEKLKAMGFWSDAWDAVKSVGKKAWDVGKKVYNNPIVKAGVDSAIRVARDRNPILDVAASTLGYGPEDTRRLHEILVRPMIGKQIVLDKSGGAMYVGTPIVKAMDAGRNRTPANMSKLLKAKGNGVVPKSIYNSRIISSSQPNNNSGLPQLNF